MAIDRFKRIAGDSKLITFPCDSPSTAFRKRRLVSSREEITTEFVLFDPFAMTMEDQLVAGEKRFVTVGSDAVGRIIAVVYTYRPDSIRLISARKATPTERKQYEKGI
jgi:hypothetical protein